MKYPSVTVAQMQVRNVWMDDIVMNKTDDHCNMGTAIS